MKYKTLYYDVTAFASRLPDDCLRIIAKYAYDESQYKYLERIPKSTLYWYGMPSKLGVSVKLIILNEKYYKLCYFCECKSISMYRNRDGNSKLIEFYML